MIAGDEALEGLLGAALAGALLIGFQRSFERREAHLLWLMPTFLLSIFLGALTFATQRPVFAGAFVSVIATSVILGRRSIVLMRAHRARLESFARSIGFELAPADVAQLALADLLNNELGTSESVLRGDWHGTRVAAFDYVYTDFSDSEAPAQIMLTCGVVSLTRSLPRLIVRPPKLREAIAYVFGSRRNVLGNRRFDSKFRVDGLDADGARDALTPRAREWLIANARGLKVAVDGEIALVSTTHRTIAELPELFERLRELRIALS